MASFRQAQKKFDKELNERINQFVLATHGVIVSETPVDTGRLRSSIVVEEEDDTWVIGTSVPYAEQIEIGMKPTVITPKNKKALYWPGAAHPVKKVNHPGFEGSHMFQKGVNWAEANARNFFRR